MITRPIGAGDIDAIGSYPRMPLAPDARLEAGVERLAGLGLVSVTFVADPLMAPETGRLMEAFEVCRPFKTHYLIERGRSGGYSPTKHHCDRIRRGYRRCRVERVSFEPFLDDWRRLYANLVSRHDISGVAAFVDPYFPTLARMPEIIVLAAFVDNEVAGMTLWFQHAGVAVSHLTAANALGYANGANFALNDAAIEHFADAAVIDLGGGAGHTDDPIDGLARFKSGFANARKVAMLCGAVLDQPAYDRLAADKNTTFFPAYRG